MKHSRTVAESYKVKATMEGAGVHLHRGFGHPELPKFDPFLLFDDFSSENPYDYLPGFPMHPHRGIETVTYIIGGEVQHKDSTGNSGSINSGDVQWMTAGNGILHEEMPKGERGLHGFQLWVNLPAEHKMMNPRYQEVKSREIPEIAYGEHARIKVIAGELKDADAPVRDIIAEPTYLDITLDAHAEITLPIHADHNAFVYVFDGTVLTGGSKLRSGFIGLLSREGDSIALHAKGTDARLLLAAGKPIGEPIAWYGPIVMNSKEELVQAQLDLAHGTFIS